MLLLMAYCVLVEFMAVSLHPIDKMNAKTTVVVRIMVCDLISGLTTPFDKCFFHCKNKQAACILPLQCELETHINTDQERRYTGVATAFPKLVYGALFGVDRLHHISNFQRDYKT